MDFYESLWIELSDIAENEKIVVRCQEVSVVVDQRLHITLILRVHSDVEVQRVLKKKGRLMNNMKYKVCEDNITVGVDGTPTDVSGSCEVGTSWNMLRKDEKSTG